MDVETGELLVGGSCAAAIAPAGLAMASAFFEHPGYLKIAEAAGRQYYADYVRKGLTTGGPGEILSAPDSESSFALMESLVKLLELTGDAFWLKTARELTRQAATWVLAYDYQFPPESTLGQSGARTTGAVWANVQNKHAAPAICTLSGEALFRLWRASGDPLALDLIRDIAHGIPQYLSRADRPLNDTMQPGWMCERVNLTDWEGPERIGETHKMTTWAETSLMLTTIEIPGLYVQPDKSLVVAFDNLTAEIVSDNAEEIVVRLTNPTPAPATVKIFSETSRQAKALLAANWMLECRLETIQPAGRKELSFKKTR